MSERTVRNAWPVTGGMVTLFFFTKHVISTASDSIADDSIEVGALWNIRRCGGYMIPGRETGDGGNPSVGMGVGDGT